MAHLGCDILARYPTHVISALAFLGLVLFPYRWFLIFFNVVSGLAMSIHQVCLAPFLMSNTSEQDRQYVFSFTSGMRTTAQFVGNWVGGSLPAWLGGLAGVAPTDTLAYRLPDDGPDPICRPPMADRLGKINTVVLTQALSVPFLLTLGLAAWAVPREFGGVLTWFYVAAGVYLFRLALMNLSGPVYQTFILEQVRPEVQALAASLNSIAFRVGWAFSPYLSGWYQTNYGFVPVFMSTAALYVLGIAIT